MARRTIDKLADAIEDRVDKDQADTVFDAFVKDQLNITMQEIVSLVPQVQWILDEDSVSSVADQQYVVLPSDMDPDAFVSMRTEGTPNKVRRISIQEADSIDPGRDLGGDEILWWFQRVAGADRIYFLHKPDSVDTIKIIFGNVISDTATGSSFDLPAKYEWVLIEGTISKLSPRIKVNVAQHTAQFEKGMLIIERDANKLAGEESALAGHRPDFSSGIHGPSFPADFDILP